MVEEDMKRDREGNHLFYAITLLIVLVLAFGVYFVIYLNSQKITGYATSDSQLGNLSVGIQTYMACTWSNEALDVQFGSNLDPDAVNVNATGNYNLTGNPWNGTQYNVTVDILSTSAANVTVYGDSLRDGVNFIDVQNVSYYYNMTYDNASQMIAASSVVLTDTDALMKSNIAAGNTLHYRWWLDIPATAVAGTYVGNYTMTCIEY